MSYTYDIEWRPITTSDGLNFPSDRSQYVSVPGDVFPSTGDFTIEFLVDVDADIDSNGMLAGAGTGSSRLFFYSNTTFGSANNEVRLWSGDLGEIVYGGDIRGAGIVRVSLVRSGSAFELFVDGVSVGTGTNASALGEFDFSELGRSPASTDRVLEGAMHDCRVWDHARTQQEIAGTTHELLDGTEAGLIHLWKMDEGIGTLVADSAGTLDGTAADDDWLSSPVTQVTDVTTTHYDLTDLDPETKYVWRARTDDDGAKSIWSDWVQFETLADSPGLTTPTNLTTTNITADSFRAGWTA